MSDEKLDLILNVVTEIRTHQKNFNADSKTIDRLELEILSIRKDAIDMREKVQELETRLSRLERHIGLAA